MNSTQLIKLMKRTIFLPVVMLVTMVLAGCDDSLIEMNTDPLKLSELPDEYLFTTAVRRTIDDIPAEYDTRFGCQYAHIYVHNTEFRSADAYQDFHSTDI